MSYKTPVSALVVIHTESLDVLLLERATLTGFWQSVTGSQDNDEPLIETARREVGEETGIQVNLAALNDWKRVNDYPIMREWLHRYAPGTTHNTEHVFSLCVARDTPVTISPHEHRAWMWLRWREAAAKCFSPSNRDAILALPERYAADR